jgi:uncharacterized protein (TIGR03437 family)
MPLFAACHGLHPVACCIMPRLATLLGLSLALFPNLIHGQGFSESPLPPGVPVSINIPAVSSPTLVCCFRIEVPSGATRLELRVAAPAGLQFAIALRFGVQPTPSPLTADYPVTVGNNPLAITPASNPPLRAGNYFMGAVVVSSPGGQTATVTATVTAPAPPPASMLTNVSAASLAAPAAPDSIVSSFGQNLAATVAQAESAILPEQLAGVTVGVTDSQGTERPGRLFFVAPGQVNFLLGAATALGAATVRVRRGGAVIAQGPLQVERVAPAIFTANSSGRGVAAAQALRVKPDSSQTLDLIFQCQAAGNCSPVPIDPSGGDQVFLLLYGTGLRGRSSPAAVAVTIDGQPAEASDAVPQGQYAGLDQLNVRLTPQLAGRGQVNLRVSIDGREANTVVIHLGGGSPPVTPGPPAEKLPAVPSGRVYQPVAAGMEWTYRVTFPQNVQIPHKPIVEAPQGLLCSNVFCGLQSWSAGQIEFRITASDLVSDTGQAELWNATFSGRGAEFFFPTTGPIQIRRRLMGEGGFRDVQLELVHMPSASFRLVRPLSRPASSRLNSGILSRDTITVPAGAFRNPVTTETQLVGDATSGFTGTYTTEVTLAPHVGIVRAIMKNPGGQVLYTMELIRFAEPSPLPLPRFRVSNLSIGTPAFQSNTTNLPLEFDFEDPSGTVTSGSLTLMANLDDTVAGGGTLGAEGVSAGQTQGRMRITAGFPFIRLISGRTYTYTFTVRGASGYESNPLSGKFTAP